MKEKLKVLLPNRNISSTRFLGIAPRKKFRKNFFFFFFFFSSLLFFPVLLLLLFSLLFSEDVSFCLLISRLPSFFFLYLDCLLSFSMPNEKVVYRIPFSKSINDVVLGRSNCSSLPLFLFLFSSLPSLPLLVSPPYLLLFSLRLALSLSLSSPSSLSSLSLSLNSLQKNVSFPF